MAEVLSPFALCADADAAAYLPDGGTADPNLLIRLVNAASEALTNLADREFVSGDATRTGGNLNPIPSKDRVFAGAEVLHVPRNRPDWFPGCERELELGDAQDVTAVSIKHVDGSTAIVDMATVTKLPRRRIYPSEPIEALGFRSSTAICDSDEITVTAKWGFPAVPERIRQEAIRAACVWYTRDVRRLGSVFAAEEQTAQPTPDLAHVLPRSGFEAALRFRRYRFG